MRRFDKVSPADLLFYAEQVRHLATVNPAELTACADLVARHLEWHAGCVLEADIRQETA